ncbi:SDR family NAD(P)-dependent oxidoreductase [Asticcacaulis solisilvae]|uniref:SDR family NAD(P)-dependent oxidoreductase n=1 Tax=Asticcacaulis solisilvae TaxID=1217274 RepID=UPI003FD6E9E9
MGRRYLITGASAGIGAAFARTLAAQGVTPILVARREDRLKSLAGEIHDAHGIESEIHVCDLSDRKAVDGLIQAIHGPVDGLINNAGYSLAHMFTATTLDAQMDFVETSVNTPTRLAHAVLPGMIERGYGRIINLSSIVAFSAGAAGHTLYPAAKAYMLKFSRSLSAEVRHKGIHVTALCPGSTVSEFTHANGTEKAAGHSPFRPLMPTQAVVDAGLAASDAGREVEIPGLFNKVAVAAMTLLPDALLTPLIRQGAKRFTLGD